LRKEFFQALLEMARDDERLFLVVGDVGYGFVEPFIREFPERYLNVGVAEQNMIGISSGLSLCGRVVFCYSICNFPTLRCVEQIRNDLCYHDSDVKIVSTGGGLGYGALGFTHHLTEDIAMMRALPNMTIIAPGDPIEAAFAARSACLTRGPFYIRLARGGDEVVHSSSVHLRIGKAVTVREGDDITLISTGGLLRNAVHAADLLKNDGISVRVLSMHTVKPIDADSILLAARETKAIVSLEEHGPIGGLSSAVAEVLAAAKERGFFLRVCVERPFLKEVGSHEYLQRVHGLTTEAIHARLGQFWSEAVTRHEQ